MPIDNLTTFNYIPSAQKHFVLFEIQKIYEERQQDKYNQAIKDLRPFLKISPTARFLYAQFVTLQTPATLMEIQLPQFNLKPTIDLVDEARPYAHAIYQGEKNNLLNILTELWYLNFKFSVVYSLESIKMNFKMVYETDMPKINSDLNFLREAYPSVIRDFDGTAKGESLGYRCQQIIDALSQEIYKLIKYTPSSFFLALDILLTTYSPADLATALTSLCNYQIIEDFFKLNATEQFHPDSLKMYCIIHYPWICEAYKAQVFKELDTLKLQRQDFVRAPSTNENTKRWTLNTKAPFIPFYSHEVGLKLISCDNVFKNSAIKIEALETKKSLLEIIATKMDQIPKQHIKIPRF